MLAAAWFALAGYDVAWPLEPARYDLLVEMGGVISRVQVKTTTRRVGQTWIVSLATNGRSTVTYDPAELDQFFVIDGDLGMYLIPSAAVGGLRAAHLSAYPAFRIPPLVPIEGKAL